MKVVIKKGGMLWQKYHLRILAENNRILCRSKKVATIEACMLTLERVKKACKSGIGLTFLIDVNWRIKQKYHFRLIDDDCNILLWSENYCNHKDCEDAIELIKANINAAEIIM
jgi:uncharacterized protein YegP (UPF0339 family)